MHVPEQYQYVANGPRSSGLHGSNSADFCNSFWGQGDDGVNVLLARMRDTAKTTEELKSFWNERAAIEEQYATRLAALSKAALGGHEIGELRNSIDALRLETENQAAAHLELASAIRSDLEIPTSMHHAKHVNHKRNQAAVEKGFKAKQAQEAFVSKAREKYNRDYIRITSFTQQSTFAQGKDLERIQSKLVRVQQTVQANEKDLENFTNALVDMMPGWEADWKNFCDTCQDLEEERMEFMKDILWSYANLVSTICVSDDEACERIRTTLENFGTERDVMNFVNGCGTGNFIPEARPFNGKDLPSSSSTVPARFANFVRVTKRTTQVYTPSQQVPQTEQPSLADESAARTPEVNGKNHRRSARQSSTPSQNSRSRDNSSSTNNSYQRPSDNNVPQLPAPDSSREVSRTATRRSVRQSTPLPIPGAHQLGDQEIPPAMPPLPPLDQETGERILFYVEALYNYTATIDEEFDFQTGDVIAVTATPDDGWWSGELLDEERREEGRHVFPSNFVRLF